jgi:hypothetical protein
VEHRWGERVHVELLVQISVAPYATDVGAISDMSMSGAWIRTNLQLPTLARARITFESIQWPGYAPAVVPAYVMRQDLHGMALEWCELAPPHVNELLFAAPGRIQVGARSAFTSRAREESANSNGRSRCDAPLILDSQRLFGDFAPASACFSPTPLYLNEYYDPAVASVI